MAGSDIQRFRISIARYEAWLRKQLDQTWQKDLDKKHAKMRESAFVFLRATYWRWAETILILCDDLADAPAERSRFAGPSPQGASPLDADPSVRPRDRTDVV